MTLTKADIEKLKALEESLWQTAVRFDRAKMEKILAPDFIEFGRSSRIYSREDCLNIPSQTIDADIPLADFEVRPLGDDVVQVTYKSVVRYPSGEEHGRRSSIWSRTEAGWQLRFHQGTAIPINGMKDN